MDECCGQIVTTRFCPHCGKHTGAGHDLISLLAYLRQQERVQAAELERRIADKASPRLMNSKDRTHRKWKSWADKLEALMKGKPSA
jgi:hypothetical protein